MAIHKDFPSSPFEVLNPKTRWFPADEALRETSYEKLLPPLVHKLREQVFGWRAGGYLGASETSKALLRWWFDRRHVRPKADGEDFEFKYYYAQREAVETIIYLYDTVKVKDKYDMIRFDSSGAVSAGMFEEDWRRFVIKMATGSGKTKVLSLILTWCYFHKLYEEGSDLARNFLVIAPNIIVLDRLRMDFDGLKIFYHDPVLPDNGYEGRNWRDDFQLKLHIQDEVNITHPIGNIFLTNIHRVYDSNNVEPSFNDDDTMSYFLGNRWTGATTDSKIDLGEIVRSIDELVILNDEAHHIHDSRLAWFKSIQDIHNKLKQKEKYLSLQVDVTATPKHDSGAIFPQTVSDYPLVEAIWQNVVKHPVLPDGPSRAKLSETQSLKYVERYADYIHLGVEEWRKAYAEHEKLGKKAVLFVMTDVTDSCDEVAEYLEGMYPELKGAVLTIHTNRSGDILESATSGKKKEELDILRAQANAIDGWDSPFKAVVSVLMLKEGWDVRNVTTIVGLRAYTAPSNILPEQTLGRGLRRMYLGQDAKEKVSVVGTEAFMDFVESIQSEGVELERVSMGHGTGGKVPMIIEVDNENVKKDIDALDIDVPVLTARTMREYKKLEEIDVGQFSFNRVSYKQFTEEEQREIIFMDITTDEFSHKTLLDSIQVNDYRSVIGFFAQAIMKELRLISGYDILYGKIKQFVAEYLFGQTIDLESRNTLRNLSEVQAKKTIFEVFKNAINELTIVDKGSAEIKDYIKLKKVRPFTVMDQAYVIPKKSVFNKIVGDSHLELEFSSFLDGCNDILSYAKNYFAVNLRIDYVNADGNISNYYPDFIVKTAQDAIYIVETKGLEDLDVPLKIERLKQWCQDVNTAQSVIRFDFVYVDEEGFNKYKPKSFGDLVECFREYKD
ncbi:MAG: DEAD/DEAH box helicase family protein [Deltaproteobacteria bacterium]|nr:DEAD/DEAH box helicase family protein [Deltaproteobacteria bacterium]